MSFPEKLKGLLEEVAVEHQLEQPTIEVQSSGPGRYVGILISKSFERIPEYLPQEWVWQKILDQFDDFEQRRVEFVHTMDPAEAWGDDGESEATPGKKRENKAKRRSVPKPRASKN
jgi:hypothetical protein